MTYLDNVSPLLRSYSTIRTTVQVASVQCRISSRDCAPSQPSKAPTHKLSRKLCGRWISLDADCVAGHDSRPRPHWDKRRRNELATCHWLKTDPFKCSARPGRVGSGLVWLGLSAHCDWWLSRSQLSVPSLMWHHDFLWVAPQRCRSLPQTPLSIFRVKSTIYAA